MRQRYTKNDKKTKEHRDKKQNRGSLKDSCFPHGSSDSLIEPLCPLCPHLCPHLCLIEPLCLIVFVKGFLSSQLIVFLTCLEIKAKCVSFRNLYKLSQICDVTIYEFKCLLLAFTGKSACVEIILSWTEGEKISFFTGQSQPPNAPTMRLQNSGDEIFIYIKIANPASIRDLFMWCKRLRESGWFTKYRNLSSQAKDHPTILKIIFDFTSQKIALTIMMITMKIATLTPLKIMLTNSSQFTLPSPSTSASATNS